MKQLTAETFRYMPLLIIKIPVAIAAHQFIFKLFEEQKIKSALFSNLPSTLR
jgi:hypothetical protein